MQTFAPSLSPSPTLMAARVEPPMPKSEAKAIWMVVTGRHTEMAASLTTSSSGAMLGLLLMSAREIRL